MPSLPDDKPNSNDTSDISRFDGSERYVATDDLKLAVNAALTL